MAQKPMKPTLRSVIYPLVLGTTVFLSACESKWEKMPDDELAAKNAECYTIDDPAAAMIQVCKNYKRECERRRSEGIYVC